MSSQQQDDSGKKPVYDASRLLVGKPTIAPSSSASSSGMASSSTGDRRLASILPPRNIDKPTQHFKSSATTFTPNFTPNFKKPKAVKTEEGSSKDDINLDVFMGQASNQTGKKKPTYTKPTKAILNKNTGFNLLKGITPSGGFGAGMIGGVDFGGMDMASSSTSGMNLTASGFGDNPKDEDTMEDDSRERRKNLFKGVKQPPIVLPFNEDAYVRADTERTPEQHAQEDSIDEIQQNLFKNNIDSLMSEDQLFFIQLPSKIPYMDASERKRQMQAQEKKMVSTSVDDAENIWTQPFENTLEKVPSGQVGEMIVYKSGKVKLKLGDVLLDVFPGSEFNFPEHVACVDASDKEKQGSCYILGNIAKRFSCVPDVDYLLKREDSNRQ